MCKRYIDHLPLAPHGDLASNPGMCPDWESNPQPFGSQAGTESTEPHQPGVAEPTSFWCAGRCSNQPSHPTRADLYGFTHEFLSGALKSSLRMSKFRVFMLIILEEGIKVYFVLSGQLSNTPSVKRTVKVSA